MSRTKSPDLGRLMTAYIPDSIARWYAQHQDRLHGATTLSGTLICLDASGFTALTRRLSDKGRQGPEILTEIINGFFDEVTQVVFAYGGDVLKFAGDALWVFVDRPFSPRQFLSDLLGALGRANAVHSLTVEQPLSIHVGAESGSFTLASLGHRKSRLEAEPVGELVQQVYAACDAAGTNELALGPTLAAAHTFAISADGFARLMAEPSPVPVGSERRIPTVKAANVLKLMERYVPTEVMAKLRSGGQRLQSEHRQATVLFARFEQMDQRTRGGGEFGALADRIAESCKIIQSLGGTIARIDPFKAGHKLLVFFGAPVKREDDELRAAACARRMTGLSDDDVNISIGLALGSLFCGDVGSRSRREYTVMGNGVNMAARLMAMASAGDILADESVMERLPDSVSTQVVRLDLKGVGAAVRCYRITDFTEKSASVDVASDILEQDEYLERLTQLWNSVRVTGGCAVQVIGEAGVGKSTLVGNFARSVGDTQVISLTCRDALLYGSGWLARKLPEELAEKAPSARTISLRDTAESAIGSRWLPLLGFLFDENIPDNEWTRDLPKQIRSQKTQELYATLVGVLAVQPVAVVVDDFYRADRVSKDLVLSLVGSLNQQPLLLVLVERSDTMEAPGHERIEQLTVSCPSRGAWTKYFDGYFESGARERELAGKLLEQSGGSPQWISRYLAYCVDRGWLTTNSVSGRWEIADSTVEMLAPESVGNLHLAAFDSLPERQREWLKAASSVFSEFHREDVAAVSDRTLPQQDITALVSRGLLVRSADGSGLDFATDAMREAVYSCLPESTRRTYHAELARQLAPRLADSRPDLLALHCFRGGSWKLALSYSLKAVRRALAGHAVIDAARLFEQSHEVVLNHSADVDSDELIAFYREYIEFLHLEGRLSEAYPACRQWRRQSKALSHVECCLEAPLETARTLWKQSRYPRARLIVERMFKAADLARWPRLEAGTNMLMAEIERRSASFDRAQQYCRQAIEIAERTNDRQRLSRAHNILGLALWGSGDLEEAAASFRKSLELEDETAGMSRRAETLNNLAIIHYALGKYRAAADLLEDTVSIFRDVGNRQNEAYASGNLANISRILGKLDRCRELLERADAVFSRTEDKHAHFYTVGNLGDLDLVLGDWASAEARFREAAEFAQAIGDKELAAECKVRMGDLSFFTDKPDIALDQYQSAIKEAEAIGSREFVLRGLIGLARLAIQRRDSDRAGKLIEDIRELAAAENVIIAENEAQFLVGELGRIDGNPQKAMKIYRKVLQYSHDNGMFELALKAAVRWFEADSGQNPEIRAHVRKLISEFTTANPKIDALRTLLTSGYFAHFSRGLNEIATGSSAIRS